MYLKEIWRYPAKSMAGEKLDQAELTPLGIKGDRQILVEAANGRILTARTHYKLLGLKATLTSTGDVLINNLPWQSAEANQLVSDTLRQKVTLIRHNGPERFDILPLLVATDGAIDYMKIDSRRLRPNLIIGGVEGLAERKWPGHILKIGEAEVKPEQLRGRCVMTTYHPDTLVQDINVLKNIVKQLDGVMALDTAVLKGGQLHLNDPVQLL
ncbi:MAG: MOSC N-terminal beta barrel domain-containing protein [Chloroflexia bacterium]